MIRPLCFYDRIIASGTFNHNRELRYGFAILPRDFLVQKENFIVINFDIAFVVIAMAYDKQAIVVRCNSKYLIDLVRDTCSPLCLIDGYSAVLNGWALLTNHRHNSFRKK